MARRARASPLESRARVGSEPTAAELVRRLHLQPHPEGGHYRRIYTSTGEVVRDGRPRTALSAILFLLARGQCSRWHRIDADEVWHWQAGGSLELLRFDSTSGVFDRALLGAAANGGRPVRVVPAHVWQSACALDGHALVTCTVSPAFEWAGFELAEADGAVARTLRHRGVFH